MRLFRDSLVAAVALSLALGPIGPGLASAASGVQIMVGTRSGLSRIEFKGTQPISARREGADIVLRFGAIPTPDLARLRVDPPKYLKTASAVAVKGGLELRLTIADGAEARLGKDEGSA